MRVISRIGLFFCALYALAIVCCLVFSLSASGDPKGQFVLTQLPICLQAFVLDAIGLGSILEGLGFVNAYLFIAPPTFAVLYLIGWYLGRLLSRLEISPPNTPLLN